MAEPPIEHELGNDEQAEREELVQKVLDLQSQLRGFITRADAAKNEYSSLLTENQMLQKYINNSLTSTAVLGATGTMSAAAAIATATQSTAAPSSAESESADPR